MAPSGSAEAALRAAGIRRALAPPAASTGGAGTVVRAATDCTSDCTCASGQTCNWSCPSGNCKQECLGVSGTCTGDCAGGGCEQDCDAGGKYHATQCSGGGCKFDCDESSTCIIKCPKGSCEIVCDGNSTCNVDCTGAASCDITCENGGKLGSCAGNCGTPTGC